MISNGLRLLLISRRGVGGRACIIATAIVWAACRGAPVAPTIATTSTPSPTPVPTPTPFSSGVVLKFLSGEDGRPVEGATVTATYKHSTETWATNANGQVALSDGNADVRITAPGFLERNTWVARTSAPLTLLPPQQLWPLTRGTTEAYVRAAVYENIHDDGIHPLRRMEAAITEIVPDTDIARDSVALSQAVRSASEVARATAGTVRFTVVEVASTAVPVFRLVVDPTRAPGVYGVFARDNRIRSGTIVFTSLEAARTAIMTHEMGHALGLGHTLEPGDVMYGFWKEDRASRFSPKEELALRMMYQRPPGNIFPDDDAAMRIATTSRGTETIMLPCRLE